MIFKIMDEFYKKYTLVVNVEMMKLHLSLKEN
jgi:hypothetical protein